METTSFNQYPVKEIVRCGPVDDGLMSSIAEALDARRGGGDNPSDIAEFDKDLKIYLPSDYIPVELLQEVAEAVLTFQRSNNKLIGSVRVRAAFVLFGHSGWHPEILNHAFVVGSHASNQGIKGTIAAENELSADAAVLKAALTDPDFTNVSTLEIVRPPANELLQLTYGALHRSPLGLGERLIVNAVVMPSFIH